MAVTTYTVLSFIGYYLIIAKMGEPGWKGLIPFYNMYCFFERVYGNGWKFLLLLIPIFNVFIELTFLIDLAKSFGEPPIFAVGLVFANPIFLLILGLNK